MESKLIAIGNSKGIRLPKDLIRKYHLENPLTIEETSKGLLIRTQTKSNKLSWKETFRETARAKEDWSAFETTTADGIED